MKQVEERIKEVQGGYIIMSRTIKTVKGVQKATKWRVIFDSRTGY